MYTIGIDYGTESGRALLVRVSDGAEIATAVHPYGDGVIDERLPGGVERLPPDWALQNPDDYVEVLRRTVPEVLRQGGVEPADVIGLGVNFTPARCSRRRSMGRRCAGWTPSAAAPTRG